MDKPALQQVDSGLKRALITYSTARLLHGAVSVLQGTQVNASPAGVGTTLTPGQILMPAAEMLKQFSDLMLLVCVSFGIQKLLITMGDYKALSIALSVTAIGWTLHGLWQKRPPAWLTKMFIVLLMVRFAIPLTVLGTDVLFQAFMAHEYTSSQTAISSVTTAQNPPTSAAPVTPGLLGKIKSWMGQPITNAIGHYEEIKSAVERAVRAHGDADRDFCASDAGDTAVAALGLVRTCKNWLSTSQTAGCHAPSGLMDTPFPTGLPLTGRHAQRMICYSAEIRLESEFFCHLARQRNQDMRKQLPNQ